MDFAVLEQDKMDRFFDLNPENQLIFCSNTLGENDPRLQMPERYPGALFDRDRVGLTLRMYAGHASGIMPTNENVPTAERGHCFAKDPSNQHADKCVKGSQNCQENPMNPCEEGYTCMCADPNPMLFWAVWATVQYLQGTGGKDVADVAKNAGPWVGQMAGAAPGTLLKAPWSTDYLSAVVISSIIQGKSQCGCEKMTCEMNPKTQFCAIKPPLMKLDDDGNVEATNPFWYLPPRHQMCVNDEGSCHFRPCPTDVVEVGFNEDRKGWLNCIPEDMEGLTPQKRWEEMEGLADKSRANIDAVVESTLDKMSLKESDKVKI